jgi:hypothetical protein
MTDENRILKMENSVEEIRQDIQDIKSALIGNSLSGERGVIGQIGTLKGEIEFLKKDLALMQEKAIENSLVIKQLKFVAGSAVAGVIVVAIKVIFA